jgi:hypothetical protein
MSVSGLTRNVDTTTATFASRADTSARRIECTLPLGLCVG